MDLGLKGKYALVTGGSRGIGFATAAALADEGCNVAICARTADQVDAAVADLLARGVEALGFAADAGVAADIDRVTESVLGAWGALHILVNNVGGGGRWGTEDVVATPEEVWEQVYAKNAMAAVRFTRAFLPHMVQQGWGRVVTVSSMYGREGGGRPWFNMAKSAEISLMKSLSMDRGLIRNGITFNSVAPGHIMIPGTGAHEASRDDPAAFAAHLDGMPLGRMGTPEEVGDVIAFMCSDRAALLNGATVAIDGGESRSF